MVIDQSDENFKITSWLINLKDNILYSLEMHFLLNINRLRLF